MPTRRTSNATDLETARLRKTKLAGDNFRTSHYRENALTGLHDTRNHSTKRLIARRSSVVRVAQCLKSDLVMGLIQLRKVVKAVD